MLAFYGELGQFCVDAKWLAVQGFLRFSSHGQCNISHDHRQTCFYFYQAHYRAYIHNTIFFLFTFEFHTAMEGL